MATSSFGKMWQNFIKSRIQSIKNTKSVHELLIQMLLVFSGNNPRYNYIDEAPLRSELFSSDQMEHYSTSLAKSHKLIRKKGPDRLLKRLADNERVLIDVRNLLAKSVKEDFQITPAGEWLLDNFYLIEEQIHIAKRHLPKVYSEGLPQLADGASAGLPRVYDIALEIISHSDGRIDMESISNFLTAYNNVTQLQIGELWAVPIMLRLALLENLRRVSTSIAIDRIHRNLGDYWAKELTATAENDPKNLILVIADMARSNPPLERSFVSEMTRQLRGKGPTLAQTLSWIEERLIENGQTSNELVQIENQKQAADQVSVSNSIGSLKLLGSMDWRTFVEEHSIVEQILRRDALYPLMDFSTRDRYRHVIESIAKNSKTPEADVATVAMKLAAGNKQADDPDERTAHVGYYLIDKGLAQTEKGAQMAVPLNEQIRRLARKIPLTIYLGSILILTAGVTAVITYKAYTDTHYWWLPILIGILTFICSSQLAVSLVNFLATLIVRPDLLPRMDFSSGIPVSSRTLVAVPAMLMSQKDISGLIEDLEVRFLANKDMHLHFALLTDFQDAREKDMPGDEELIACARQKIDELNKKYELERSDIFYLFHRPRLWNPRERAWMGYERKRGKLGALNAFLKNGVKDPFSLIVGQADVLRDARYVITLDSDTQLPRDSARKIVAAISHLLNRAVYDPAKKRVTDGYGILQPRVSVSLPGIGSSLYTRMNGNEPGLDPYTRATSDVYQDLFGEGSFIGKGIYDVDVFEKVLGNNFPENRILSHDLLEGSYVRSGLLSDVQLYEKYPSRYATDMKRRHRWIRGDWQIYAWFLPFVPDANRKLHLNPLSALSRWKIFDNIRRSIVPIALCTLLACCWLFLPVSGVYTLIVTGIIVLPAIISSVWEIMRKPKDVILWHHLIITSRSAGNSAVRVLFTAVCMPYEAYVSLDAILRTVWRMLISHRHLLEWAHFANTERENRKTLFASYLSMWVEPLAAIAIAAYLYFSFCERLAAPAPILLLWIAGPFITWWVSRPSKKKDAILTAEQHIFLHKLARKTWTFFERLVIADDNWLPPDNYQEYPLEATAHRTSPTNIGLSLLANLTAYDFGYISMGRFAERTTHAIESLDKMERLKGHFYNWYDTQTLQPMTPRYISTVDSGNLAGHLLTLRQGIMALPHQKIVPPGLFTGLRSSLLVLMDSMDKSEAALLEPVKTELYSYCHAHPASLDTVKANLESLSKNYEALAPQIITGPATEISWRRQALTDQIKDILDELHFLAPWTAMAGMPAKFASFTYINEIPTLHDILKMEESVYPEVTRLREEGNSTEENDWLTAFQNTIADAVKHAAERVAALDSLAVKCNSFADMEWDFLYDKNKDLLSIGYNTIEHRCDLSFYDLLASEARLSVFVAIAQDKIPQESWFALSRLLTNVNGSPILLSWSGSMFEYLMPLLVMPTYNNTLLDETDRAAVEWQIEYGRQRDVPWGISESGYNMIDAAQNYQYRAFGAPGLGLKRGLGEDLVIAPYASMLGLMVMPEAACKNLEDMVQQGFEGKYGMYEAIDYTPSRLSRGQNNAIVQSFMAHHQGMSLLSLAYLLLEQPMQKRFEAEPQFQATQLLLQERVPKAISVYAHTTDIEDYHAAATESEIRVIRAPSTPAPEVQLLSNGKYHVMVTNAGGGYSRWKDMAITRWREDATCDNWGTFCYIRDLDNNAFWSTAHQPTLKKTKTYEAAFSQGRADFRCSNNNIDTHTEIVVSPEDDIEMRRFTITNRSGERRSIEITSYAEVVIESADADASHPAFGNLFVQTEILPQLNAILCTRRPKTNDEKLPWMFHLMKVHGKDVKSISYETDRMKFIGRGNTIINPQAMRSSAPLSGSQGSVLDPIVSIRHQFTLAPDESVTVDMIIGMGDTREICQNLIDKYQDKHHKDRVFELAWTHTQVILRHINASETEAQSYCRLAGSVIYINPALRADPDILIKNHRGQAGLWPYSISGDLPIVLIRIEEETNIELVRQMVQAYSYWKLKGLVVDLVIINENHGGYRQVLQNQISDLVAAQTTNQRGGIFVRSAEQISNEDRILFQTVARVIISGDRGTLADHLNRRQPAKTTIAYITPPLSYANTITPILPPGDLQFNNGYGGFSPAGDEYIITINERKTTPAPWVNVIANANFGTVISECGQSYTWSENAHEFRLSPWGDDPVSDTGGEAFYLRDEENGYFWSPAPLPRGGQSGYTVRHGFGYSVYEHTEAGIHSEMWVYVDLEATIKFTLLKLKNVSGRNRRISATGYVEWVLAELKPKSAMYVVSELSMETGSLIARNPYNTEFPDRVAFFDTDESTKTYTADRSEFIGRNGSMRNPDGMTRVKLSGKLGVGLDPCAAIQVSFDLLDGQEKEVVFKLGAGKTFDEARQIIQQFRGVSNAKDALDRVTDYWKYTIGALRIETPDAAINTLANGWLTYQTIACRVWARSGFYQSGGAFGFRDQLQDTMSLVHSEPKLLRAQLLLSASRQYKQGDVQHWWHPPVGRGVRTRISDDFLWLPFAACRYVATTQDTGVLTELVPFLEGRLLNPDEDSYYELPGISSDSATLYDHCVRAIKNGLKFGSHGLSLMGTGDWNDGMDRVGRQGKGESVWLSFFLYNILTQFIDIARLQKDEEFAQECEKQAATLKENINNNGWDGNWFRRAYFDDGTPLGSQSNEECQIDSIAQSWSILSKAGDTKYIQTAIDSANVRLVDRQKGLVKLLDPPFDKSAMDPGYIKGYVPGVRENGGQYTHAAIWLVMAFAQMKDSKRTWELLNMINPINHGRTADEIATYKVEPYVMAGDVYAVAPHTGRGGWTWYSGSAGWMYHLITESFLGLKIKASILTFDPCIPSDWPSFKVHYRYYGTMYHITVTQEYTIGKMTVMIDGQLQATREIMLVDDEKDHHVEIQIFSSINVVTGTK
jgi:cyclic beta-1,2-glucan synthetase